MNIVDWREWSRVQNKFIVIAHDLDTMSEEDRAALFEDRLNNHDFWHNMSDDHNVYMRGREEARIIREIAKTLPAGVANFIWNAYILRLAGSEENVERLGLIWNPYKDVE